MNGDGPNRRQKFLHYLKIRFARHEAWAIKMAQEVPLFSTFVFATLCLWGFLPVISITFVVAAALEYLSFLHVSPQFFETTFGIIVLILGGVLCSVVAIGAMILICPWYFRWYFICCGLMFGRTKMAQTKEREIASRLERLQMQNV